MITKYESGEKSLIQQFSKLCQSFKLLLPLITIKTQETCINLLKQIGWLIIEKFICNFYVFKTFNSEFSYREVWLTDQQFETLQIRDRTNITLIIKRCIIYKITCSLSLSTRFSIGLRISIFAKVENFCLVPKTQKKSISKT